MKRELSESAKRIRKIAVAIFLLIGTLGALLVWQVDLFHLHFGYRDAKEEYLNAGMPWTSEDLYRGLTQNQIEQRDALVKSAEAALKSYELDENQRYERVTRENALKRLRSSASMNPHLDRMVELAEAPLLGLIDLDYSFNAKADKPGTIKRALELLALRGEWKITSGSFEAGLDDLKAAYSIARSQGESEAILGYTIGYASLAVIDQSMVKAANAVSSDSSKLKILEDLLLDSYVNHPLPKNALKGEALAHLAFARNADILSEISSLIFQEGFPGNFEAPGFTSGDPRTIGRRSLAVPLLQLWAGVGDSMKKHPNDQEKWFAALKIESAKAYKRGGLTGQIVEFYTPDSDIVMGFDKRYKSMRLVNLSLLRGVRMSLERRANLEIEAAMELDPYSGEPLIWKSSGSTFKVWSVGPNGLDDGGISKADYLTLMSSTGSGAARAEAYDVPATFPWEPRLRPSGSKGTVPSLNSEAK